MVRLISRQRGGLAALKLTKLFGIDDFPAAKASGKVLIIIIYCYLIIAVVVVYLFKGTTNTPVVFVWESSHESSHGFESFALSEMKKSE